jgi:hypothetical protein
MQKFNNRELEAEIITAIKEAEIPVAIDYVAQKFELAWGTARAILLDLALRGKIRAQKTTKSFIFWVEK